MIRWLGPTKSSSWANGMEKTTHHGKTTCQPEEPWPDDPDDTEEKDGNFDPEHAAIMSQLQEEEEPAVAFGREPAQSDSGLTSSC